VQHGRCVSGACLDQHRRQLVGLGLSPQRLLQCLDCVLEIAFLHRQPGGSGLRRDRPEPALALRLGPACGLRCFAALPFRDFGDRVFELNAGVLDQRVGCAVAQPLHGLRVTPGLEIGVRPGNRLAGAPLGPRDDLPLEFIEGRLHELMRRGLTKMLERLLVIAPRELRSRP
jgi:hypothetical protein